MTMTSMNQDSETINCQRLCESLDCNDSLSRQRNCVKCNHRFCAHYASKIDFQFCLYCMHDVVLEDSIIRRIEETKSLNGKKTFTRIMRARHLVFKGQDWMFAQARVVTLSDAELETTIEYHRAIMSEMVNEREARKIAANRKQLQQMYKNSASLKIPSKTPGFYTDGTPISADAAVVTTTTVKRTRTTIPGGNTIQNALAGIIAVWKAQGKSEEDIKGMLMSMAGK